MKSLFRFKILIIMITAILIPVIFLTLFITTNSALYHDRFVSSSFQKSVRIDSKRIEQFFIESEEELRLYANILKLSDDEAVVESTLNQFIHNNEGFSLAFYTDILGHDYISHNKETNVDGETRVWYQTTAEAQNFTISAPYEDIVSGLPVITLAVPVYRDNEFYGVFGVDYMLSDIILDIQDATALEDATFLVSDAVGKYLQIDEAITDKDRDNLVQMAKGSPKYNIDSIYLENLKFQLSIIYDVDAYKNDVRAIRIEMTLLFIFIILITIVLAFSIAKRLSDPLKNFKKRIVEKTPHMDEVEDISVEEYWDEEFVLLFAKFKKLSQSVHIERSKLSTRMEQLKDKNEMLMEKNMDLEEVYKNLKLMDRKVRKSRKEYESILENIQGMIWVLDGKGSVVYANSTLLNQLGYTLEEIVGQSYEKIIKNSYHDKFSILELIGSRDFKRIEMNLYTKEELWINVEANTSRVLDETNELLYIYGICRMTSNVKELHYNYNVNIQEQNLIMELTETASMNVSMGQVTKVIFEKINSIFGWSVGTIRFLNDNKEFELIARTDTGNDYIVNQSLEYDHSCLTYVVENDEILYVNHSEELPIKEEIYCQILEDGYSLIFIPVGNNDIGRGVISLTIDRVSMLEKEEMLKSFTNTILIVVERALIYEKLKKDYIRMIKVLAEAGDDKDSSSVGHSNRVASYSKVIGEHLYLDDDEIVELEICGLLHDIGKIGISDEYLSDTTEVGIEKVKAHPIIGRRMLEDIGLADEILSGIEMHHMNFDLTGYPTIPEVESLPLFPRIIQVADEYDNLKETGTFSNDNAIYSHMSKAIGTLYCPQVMRVFKDIIDNHLLEK